MIVTDDIRFLSLLNSKAYSIAIKMPVEIFKAILHKDAKYFIHTYKGAEFCYQNQLRESRDLARPADSEITGAVEEVFLLYFSNLYNPKVDSEVLIIHIR